MPVMDGRTCYEHIRRDVRVEAPVVILSAMAERTDIGAQGALSKPFDPLELVAAVDRLVRTD